METLAFIHTAVAYEDPSPESELRSFEDISLKAPGSIALGVLSAGVVTATLSHADQAQALIEFGDRGSGVAQLQRKLGVTDDGIFGRQTYNSLVRFQENNRLVPDGIAGRRTLPALGLSSTLPPGPFIPEREPKIGSSLVTARIGLVVRDAPNGGYIYTLPYLSRVSRVDSTVVPSGGYNWTRINGGGWVASEYLDYGFGSREQVVAISGPFANVRTTLRVRNRPAGTVIDSIGAGRSLSLTGAEQLAGGRTWSQLANGGWVARDYIGFR